MQLLSISFYSYDAAHPAFLTKVVCVEFGKRVESEADTILGRCKTDVAMERRDDGCVLAVGVEGEETVDLIDGVLQLEVGVRGREFQL